MIESLAIVVIAGLAGYLVRGIRDQKKERHNSKYPYQSI